MPAGGDKSEKATPRKKEKSRREGQVANSKELASVAVLFASILVFYFSGGWMLDSVKQIMQGSFLMIGQVQITTQTLYPIALGLCLKSAVILAPIMLLILVCAISVNVAQVGFNISAKPITPDLKKIDPVQGAKKLISLRSLVELIKSVMKISVISLIAYKVIEKSFETMIAVGLFHISDIFALVGSISLRILWYVTLALVGLAILDYTYQRYDNEKKMKMTKQEVKDEHKNYEGDPKIKQRQRAIQREMAFSRMMSHVPEADVILTNPTHVAVAISYKSENHDAPTVTAKGAGFVAQKIREKAAEAGVPILERPPLARELFRKVNIGNLIPSGLYEAVAEVLAYIYNLKNVH